MFGGHPRHGEAKQKKLIGVMGSKGGRGGPGGSRSGERGPTQNGSKSVDPTSLENRKKNEGTRENI